MSESHFVVLLVVELELELELELALVKEVSLEQVQACIDSTLL